KQQCNALESEFQALIISMQNCWSKGYTRVCFEGDNKEVEELLNGNKLNFGMFNWIREVRIWRSRFTDCQFRWCHRSSNVPADLLAKHQIPFNSSFYFHNLVPHVMTNALHSDFSNLII
ncbi:Ribonuclease H-like superfamily, partial [Arabidopsis suecica]